MLLDASQRPELQSAVWSQKDKHYPSLRNTRQKAGWSAKAGKELTVSVQLIGIELELQFRWGSEGGWG